MLLPHPIDQFIELNCLLGRSFALAFRKLVLTGALYSSSGGRG